MTDKDDKKEQQNAVNNGSGQTETDNRAAEARGTVADTSASGNGVMDESFGQNEVPLTNHGGSEVRRTVTPYSPTRRGNITTGAAYKPAPFAPTVRTTTPEEQDVQEQPSADDTEENSSGVDRLLQAERDAKEQYDKDAAELRRKRNSQAVIGGITDAARALANIYYTGKGTGQLYDPTTSMNEKAQERYSRAKAELDANYAHNMAYINRQMEGNRAEESMKIQRERLKNQQEETERKRINDEYKRQWNDYEQQYKEKQLQLLEQYRQGKLDIDRMNAESRRMSAEAAKWRAQHGGAGSSMPNYTVSTRYERNELGDIISITKTRTVDGQEFTTSEVVQPHGTNNNGKPATTNNGGKGGKQLPGKKKALPK